MPSYNQYPRPGFEPAPQTQTYAPNIVPQPSKPPLTQPPSAILPDENNNKKIAAVILSTILIMVIIGGAVFLLKGKNSENEDINSNTDRNLKQTTNTQSNPTPIRSPTPSPNNPQNFYSNPQFGISFSGPEGWEKIEGYAGTLVAFRSPEKEIGDNNVELQANLNLVVDPNLQTANLDTYAKQANATRAILFQNYKLLGTTKEILGQQSAQIDDFNSTSGSINLRQRQVYTIKGNGAYILTFTATTNSWDKLLPTFDNVRNSFIFTGVVSGARTGF